MVGDFDDSADALWSLHAKEAQSHDEARIQSLKNNMDGVLIFVRAYISLYEFMPRANVLESFRQGYSLLHSLPLSSIDSKVSKWIQRNRWCTTSNKTSRYLLRSLNKSLPLLLMCPSRPLLLHHILIFPQTPL